MIRKRQLLASPKLGMRTPNLRCPDLNANPVVRAPHDINQRSEFACLMATLIRYVLCAPQLDCANVRR